MMYRVFEKYQTALRIVRKKLMIRTERAFVEAFGVPNSFVFTACFQYVLHALLTQQRSDFVSFAIQSEAYLWVFLENLRLVPSSTVVNLGM